MDTKTLLHLLGTPRAERSNINTRRLHTQATGTRPPAVRRNTRAACLGHKLADRGLEEVGGVAGVPTAAEPLLKLELHEVSCDEGDEHVAGLAADGIVELEDAVVRGPPRPRLHPARPARRDLRHGRLLCNVHHADRAAAAAAMHRERRGRRGGEWGIGRYGKGRRFRDEF
jgi:hypothetical protein